MPIRARAPSQAEFDPNSPAPGIGGDYGGKTEVDMNTVNQWMRAQPWYQDKLTAWFGPPGPARKVDLNNSQKKELVRIAQTQGIKVDEGDTEIDGHGNFRAVGHKLRNTLIVAGLAAASLATLGAAGAFAGAAGAAGGGAGAAGAALPGATLGMSTALPGAISTIPGLATVGAAAAGGAAGGLGGAAGAGGTGTLATVGKLVKTGQLLGDVGHLVGGATSAAGQNRLAAGGLEIAANQSNIAGQSAMEQALINRANLEAAQRKSNLQNIYRESYAVSPTASPYNVAGPPKYSPAYLQALGALSKQGQTQLANAPQGQITSMPAVPQYKPISPQAPGSGTMQQIGNWLSPALSIAGRIASR